VTDSMPPSGEPDFAPGSEELLDSHAGDPLAATSEPTAPRSRRTRFIVGGAVAALAVAGGAAWAAVSFLGAGEQPAEALPAGTLGYVSVNFDPAGEQKLEALKTLKKFPGLADKLNFDTADDVRKHIFEEIQNSGDCEEVDYAADIEPWLGNRMAVAAVEAGEDNPSPVFVVETSDTGKAEAGLKKLAACDESSDEYGVSFRGDWALVAETQEIADKVAADTESGTLADDADFQKWVDEAGDSGIVTMYAAPEVGKAIRDAMEEGMQDEFAMLPEGALDQLDTFKGAGGVVRFDNGSLEVEFAGGFDPKASGLDFTGTAGGAVVTSLPDSTAFALGLAVPDGYFDKILESFGMGMAGSGMSTDDLIAELEQQTGLEFPEDFDKLTGDALAIAVSSNLDIDKLMNAGDPSDLGVGVKVKGNPADIESVLDKIRPQLGADASFLASATEGDVVAFGPSASWNDELKADGGLGDTATFKDVIANADKASSIIYLDFDADNNWLVEALKTAEAPDEVVDNVEPLAAFGASSWLDGDVSHAVIRLTTD